MFCYAGCRARLRQRPNSGTAPGCNHDRKLGSRYFRCLASGPPKAKVTKNRRSSRERDFGRACDGTALQAAILRMMGAERPYARSKPIVIEEGTIDDPRAGEVLVKIAGAGLCHSDLSIINGSRPRPLPWRWDTKVPVSSPRSATEYAMLRWAITSSFSFRPLAVAALLPGRQAADLRARARCDIERRVDGGADAASQTLPASPSHIRRAYPVSLNMLWSIVAAFVVGRQSRTARRRRSLRLRGDDGGRCRGQFSPHPRRRHRRHHRPRRRRAERRSGRGAFWRWGRDRHRHRPAEARAGQNFRRHATFLASAPDTVEQVRQLTRGGGISRSTLPVRSPAMDLAYAITGRGGTVGYGRPVTIPARASASSRANCLDGKGHSWLVHGVLRARARYPAFHRAAATRPLASRAFD